MRADPLGLQPQVRRYRFMVGRQVGGPVRETRGEAVADAVAANMATYDEQYRRVFITVPARIEHVAIDD